ncbi:MAG: SEC-C metal-binding domain-containing protein [Betaproteobacteria bacterium]
MIKVGRNSPCPCGSGEKYKRCCEQKEAALKRTELPAGRFRYEAGSYGGPGRGYMPSILGYKEIGPDSWTEHLCLVKQDAVLEDQDMATSMAEKHLAAARQAKIDGGGSPQSFALSLRHEGYKSVSDFRMVNAHE